MLPNRPRCVATLLEIHLKKREGPIVPTYAHHSRIWRFSRHRAQDRSLRKLNACTVGSFNRKNTAFKPIHNGLPRIFWLTSMAPNVFDATGPTQITIGVFLKFYMDGEMKGQDLVISRASKAMRISQD